MAELKRVFLPNFGESALKPSLPIEIHQARLRQTLSRFPEFGIDLLCVYADREHSANLNFLIGFDPRFEEVLLLLNRAGEKLLLVGNECMGYLPDERLQCKIELFQDFSLMGQPRDSSRPLKKILSSFGIGPTTRVGCAGWKYYDDPHSLDIPSFIADALRSLAGDSNVINAGGLFMNPKDGLRLTCDVHQIACLEYAHTRTSLSVWEGLKAMKIGASEIEVGDHFRAGGLVQNCHPMTSFGEKARRGLSSPGNARAELGQAFTLAYGLEGALTARAGVIAHDENDLREPLRSFYPIFARNYAEVVHAWYEALDIGKTGGEIFDAVEAKRDPSLFDFALNPGHYIHLDEWVHSPFYKGSPIALQSGVALQMDIIPISKGPFCAMNGEDGVVLANVDLRAELSKRFPEAWKRIAARRKFMFESLGIKLSENVLLLSNIPAAFPPYALSPDQLFVSVFDGGKV